MTTSGKKIIINSTTSVNNNKKTFASTTLIPLSTIEILETKPFENVTEIIENIVTVAETTGTESNFETTHVDSTTSVNNNKKTFASTKIIPNVEKFISQANTKTTQIDSTTSINDNRKTFASATLIPLSTAEILETTTKEQLTHPLTKRNGYFYNISSELKKNVYYFLF
jgi:hypothetical protein